MSQASAARRLDLGGGVWAEVVRDWYNPVIKRRELTLVVHHTLKPTPMRFVLRSAVANAYGVDISRVYVREIRTEYGIGRSRVQVHIYDSKERALQFEPEYIIERNGGVEPEAM
ncbi:30S ribosomal protein S24e [Stetteria hydrogenophila]